MAHARTHTGSRRARPRSGSSCRGRDAALQSADDLPTLRRIAGCAAVLRRCPAALRACAQSRYPQATKHVSRSVACTPVDTVAHSHSPVGVKFGQAAACGCSKQAGQYSGPCLVGASTGGLGAFSVRVSRRSACSWPRLSSATLRGHNKPGALARPSPRAWRSSPAQCAIRPEAWHLCARLGARQC